MNHGLRLRGGVLRTCRPAEHEPASAACLSPSPAGVTGGRLGCGQASGLVLTTWQAGAVVPRRRDRIGPDTSDSNHIEQLLHISTLPCCLGCWGALNQSRELISGST